MSEPCSLFIRIQIQEKNLNRFFAKKPTPQLWNADWKKWWESRQVYSQTDTLPMIKAFDHANYREVFNEMLEKRRSYFSVEKYNNEHSTWTFACLFYSENFFEIIPMLSLLSDLASFQDPTERGLAVIYDFHWGSGEVMAHVEFDNAYAKLTTISDSEQIETESRAQIEAVLQSIIRELNDE